jgi:hypothetical protein
MAQRTIIQLIDDLDGTSIDEDGQTVPFALDGVDYEIDLSAKNAEALRAALADFVPNARRVGRKTGRAGQRSRAGASSREIRDWARSNGWPNLSDRGRVPADVQQAWDAR